MIDKMVEATGGGSSAGGAPSGKGNVDYGDINKSLEDLVSEDQSM